MVGAQPRTSPPHDEDTRVKGAMNNLATRTGMFLGCKYICAKIAKKFHLEISQRPREQG